MLFKRITTTVIAASLLVSLASPCYATEINSTENSTPDLKLSFENQQNIITPSEMKQNVQQAIDNGTIEKEYADKLLVIVEKYADSYSEADLNLYTENYNRRMISDYYNPETGAMIQFTPAPNDPLQVHGSLMMNKAGFDIIKEIIAMGGGATAIGAGVAAVTGSVIGGGAAAIIGGALVVQAAAISLQFGLGREYAYCIC